MSNRRVLSESKPPSRWRIVALTLLAAVATIPPATLAAQVLEAGVAQVSGFEDLPVSNAAQAVAKDADPFTEIAVIVLYSKGFTEKEAQIGALGGTVSRSFTSLSGYAVRVTSDELEALAQDPDVEWVALDAELRANLDLAREVNGVPADHDELAAYTGSGVTVAILDSGIYEHRDLRDRVVASIDILSDGTTFQQGDPFGHGTHVAGIVAGDGKRSSGAYRGVAREADLVSVRVLDHEGAGTTSGVIAGLEWIMAHRAEYGIQVVSMSLGHPIYEPAEKDPLVLAVEAVWDAGIVVVCSAGNRGRDGYFTVTSPGNAPNCLAIGSSTDGEPIGSTPVRSTADGDLGAVLCRYGFCREGKRVAEARTVADGVDDPTAHLSA